MLLAYLDESFSSDRYVISALIVPDHQAKSLTFDLDELATNLIFDIPELKQLREFHGHSIMQAKDDWEPLQKALRLRIGVFEKCLKIIAKHDVKIIIRSVDLIALRTKYRTHLEPHEICLSFLYERIDEYAIKEAQNVLVMADGVIEEDGHRKDLWRYQRTGTWGYRSRIIQNVIDTIYFTPSHSSRLVQAADLIAYLAHRYESQCFNSSKFDPKAVKACTDMWKLIRTKVYYQGTWTPI